MSRTDKSPLNSQAADTKPAAPNHPFWTFSLALYGATDVKNQCLMLQDKHRVNINVVLWACWLAEQGVELSEAQLKDAIKAIQPSQTLYIEPLRKVRKNIQKTADHELYQQTLKAELAAEKVQQSVLYQFAITKMAPADAQCLETNIQQVLKHYDASSQLADTLKIITTAR